MKRGATIDYDTFLKARQQCDELREQLEAKDREIERLKGLIWTDLLLKSAIEFGAENSHPFGDDNLNDMVQQFKLENNL